MARDTKIVSKHLTLDSTQIVLLNKILSGLMDHQGFDSSIASSLQRELFRTLLIEEVYGVYYLIYKVLESMSLVSLSFNKKTRGLTRDAFMSAMEYFPENQIRKPEFDAQKFFEEDYGVSFNLSEGVGFNEALDAVTGTAASLFDELVEMAIPTEEAFTYIPALRESLKKTMTEYYLTLEAAVLKGKVVLNGKVYSGAEDAMQLRSTNHNLFNARFNQTADPVGDLEVVASNSAAVKLANEENPHKIKPSFYLGWEPIDSAFPIQTQDIVSIVADEGVGKTKLTVDLVYKAVIGGRNVLLFCGETAVSKMQTLVVLRHIDYLNNGISISLDEYNNRALIPCDTDEQRIEINSMIAVAECDLYDNPKYGKIVYKQDLPYEEYSKYISECVDRFSTEVVVTDHVAALRTSGERTIDGFLDSDKKRIDFLFKAQNVLTKRYNLVFLNTVHTENTVSDKLAAGKEVGIRIAGGSRYVTKYSTIVMLLRDTDELRANSLILIDFKKTRDHARPPKLAIRRNGRSNRHDYLPALQKFVTGVKDDITNARMDALLGVEEEDTEDMREDIGLDI